MLYPELKKLGVGILDGVEEAKIYPVCNICIKEMTEQVINTLKEHNYDLANLHPTTFRLFTMNEKELERVLPVLDRIDELNLKDVFQENLNISSLKTEIVERIKFCLDNNVPYCYQDTFILLSEIYSAEAFAQYTIDVKPVTKEEIDTKESSFKDSNLEIESVLDPEDANVRSEILKTLLEIKDANKDDFTFNMIIATIIADLDNIIAKDNKNYRNLGTRHLIEDALQGINLDPKMYNEIDTKLLSAFPDHENTLGIERSAA